MTTKIQKFVIQKLTIAGKEYEYPDTTALVGKINELVDVVNALQEIYKSCDTQIGILAEQIAKIQHDNSEKANCQENVQDKFTEQRKWIGKLCRFWNFKDGAVDMGILKTVDNLKPAIPYINDIDCSYAYCEPVKPDDDIIYKGGDNE